jgi:tetratricopeptide (TPR) repeat protein
MSSAKITFIFVAALTAAWLPANSSSAATAEQMMQLREHINKGNTYLAHNQFDKALDEYDKCLMIDPGNSAAKENIILAHNNCGMMFYYQKRYADAKAEWDEALKLNPYDRNIKRNLGILKSTLERLDQQNAAKKPAAKENPDNAAANNDGATASGAVIINGAPKAAPQEQPSASGAVILNGGGKHSEGSADAQGSAATAPSAPSGTYEEIPTYNGGSIRIMSGPQNADTEPSSSSAAVIISPKPTAPPAAVIISPTTASPPTYVTPTPAVSAPTTVSTPTAVYNRADVAPAGGTIEEKLNQIEMKVYGRTQADVPVFKRLEKLEMDTGGAVKSGSVQQRVETLRRAYGI